MSANRKWPTRVSYTALAVMAGASGHLIEDYLYGVPADLGLRVPLALWLAIAYYAVFGWILILAARGRRGGYIGCLVMGAFLALAEILYHGPQILFEWPYRHGWLSKGFEVGIILGSIALAILASLALRAGRRTPS